MRSNYKRIGDFIKQVSLKNTKDEFDELLGINIDKFFMPSVANVIGTDLKRYKVVKKHQFACNRMHVGRDYRIPIALSRSETPFIVSPAYTVFEITDTSIIDPDYLMMWFSRPEFDREVWFHTDADVRGGLPWEMFCDIELPIPSIEKQRAIVKEYSTVVNRIKLNEELNRKLEETAQAIYKEWFVDFNFPITEESCPELASGFPHLIGKPYKSSGGEMVWNEELDKEVPEGWELLTYEKALDFKTGKLNSNAAVENGKYPFFTCSSETFKTNTFSFDCEALLLAGNNASAIYPFKYFKGKFDAYQRTYVIKPLDGQISIFQSYFEVQNQLEGFKGTSSGTATKFLTMKLLNSLFLLAPCIEVTILFDKLIRPIFERIMLIDESNELLIESRDILSSKMSKV